MTASVTWLGHATVADRPRRDTARHRPGAAPADLPPPPRRARAAAARPRRACSSRTSTTTTSTCRRSQTRAPAPRRRAARRQARPPPGFAHVARGRGGRARSELGSLRVEAVEAEHEATGGPLRPPVPAVGYVIRGSRTVYFAGDTDLFAGMAALAPLDVALLPVAGWGPRLRPGTSTRAGAPRRRRCCARRSRCRSTGAPTASPGRGGPRRAPAEEFAAAAAAARAGRRRPDPPGRRDARTFLSGPAATTTLFAPRGATSGGRHAGEAKVAR